MLAKLISACVRAGVLWTLALAAVWAFAGQSRAQIAWEGTILTNVARSGNSYVVQGVSAGQSMLSDGSMVSFRQWYASTGQDLHFTMLTPVNEDLGLIWGFGTGERGEKYAIDPSLRLGFITKHDFTDVSTLSLSASVVLGGHLTERPCQAGFGSIGGTMTVNCRLAATPMRPEETLEYLFDEDPLNQVEVSLTYRWRF